jgi:diaminopimelate epimerase
MVASHQFWKLHGLGNDFVFLDAMKHNVELSEKQVAALCDRHTGIGADGVIVVKPSPRPECAGYMHYINSDGTLAQMCGNGVRCFGKFLIDHGYVDASAHEFVADTLAGPRPITFEVDAAGLMSTATVNMGAPILAPAEVPTTLGATKTTQDSTAYVEAAEIESPWGSFAFSCVSMGNPHAVCFLDEEAFAALPQECFGEGPRSLSNFNVALVGAFFEKHEAFPEKTNVEFAVVENSGRINMRVFERGCGETHACGTGACATQVAAHLSGRTNTEADVVLLGGTLHIALRDGSVFMTGPATESFAGNVDLDAFA